MIFFKGIKVEEKLFFEFASIKKNEKILFLGFDQATKAEYNEYRNITIQSSYEDEISNDYDVIVFYLERYSNNEVKDYYERFFNNWHKLENKIQVRLIICTPGDFLYSFRFDYIKEPLIKKRQISNIRLIEVPGMVISLCLLLCSHSESDNIEYSHKDKKIVINYKNLKNNILNYEFYDSKYDVQSPDETFNQVLLGELVDIKIGMPLAQVKKENGKKGVPIFLGSDIYESDAEKYVQEDDKFLPFLCNKGDILIPKIFSQNKFKTTMIKKNLKLYFSDTVIRIRVREPKILNLDFLNYFLNSKLFKLQIERGASLLAGGVFRLINTKQLSEIIIFFPDFVKQKEIVETYNDFINKAYYSFPSIPNLRKIKPRILDINDYFEQWIKNYPPPISNQLIRYKESKTRQNEVWRQFDNLKHINERIVFHLWIIAVAETINLKLTDLFLCLFNSMLSFKPHNGSAFNAKKTFIVAFISRIMKEKIPTIFPFTEITIEQIEEFGKINRIRNTDAHSPKNSAWLKNKIETVENLIFPILKKLADLLTDHVLIRIENIRPKRDSKKIYEIISFIGERGYKEESMELESSVNFPGESVILFSNSSFQHLNLHPFYFYKEESLKNPPTLLFLKYIEKDKEIEGNYKGVYVNCMNPDPDDEIMDLDTSLIDFIDKNYVDKKNK